MNYDFHTIVLQIKCLFAIQNGEIYFFLFPAKFTENDHEKVDRLLELHIKYYRKVEEADQR